MLVLTDRRLLTLGGVEDVPSFDETNLLIRTSLGLLSVDGTDLHILKLDLKGGEIAVEGTFTGVCYLDQNPEEPQKNGRFRRLFR